MSPYKGAKYILWFSLNLKVIVSMFILLIGDIVNGFQFIGPFNESDDVIEYVTKMKIKDDWEVVQLTKP